jgi:hypothetical protein
MNPVIARQFDPYLLSRVEDAGLNASAPPQQRWLDGWLVRLSPGKAKRARCINAVAAGRMPVPNKLALCEPVYAQAALPLIVRITPFSEPIGLDATLDAMGLQRFDDTRVMVLQDLPAIDVPSLPAGISIQSIGLEAFAQRVGALRGSPLSQRLAHGQRLVQSPVPFRAYRPRPSSTPQVHVHRLHRRAAGALAQVVQARDQQRLLSLANTKMSTRLVSLQACTSKKPSSSVFGSASGITRTKRSPS